MAFKKKYLKSLLFFLCFSFFFVYSNEKNLKKQDVFFFSYFKNHGKDGLYLAYSKDGLKWKVLNEDKSFLKPEIGRDKDKVMRDPCVFLDRKGTFHMVWTVRWNNHPMKTGRIPSKGIGYSSSKDLIHWEKQRYLPVMEHEPKARNCWAPELSYDDESKLYMIYWSSTIPGRYPKTDATGDNGYNHRMYYVTTKDFKKFSDTKLFYDDGFNVIDGNIIKVEKKWQMVLKDETRHPPAKNFRVATSKSMIGPYGKASKPITMTEKYWAEGPSLIKHKNRWILYFDKYTKGKMGVMVTFDWKNWNDISNQLSFPKGTRHGTVFKAPLSVLRKIKRTYR